MLSLQYCCIFVHIQKTGGESIRAMLGAESDDPHKHRTAQELRDLYGEETWASCFKFAFVRNPWDRLVSWWSMIDAMRPNLASGQANVFQRFVLTRAATFDEFLLNCDQAIEDDDGRKHIFQNQIDYLTDADGSLLVDFIGRFEDFSDDLRFVCERTGADISSLERRNNSRHRPYREYYSEGSAAFVARRYTKDIAAFGYSFAS